MRMRIARRSVGRRAVEVFRFRWKQCARPVSLTKIGRSCGRGNRETSCMIITSHLFDAYLKCPTKCWLRSREDLSAGNGYADSVCAENEAYRAEESERLLSSFPESDRAITSPGLQNVNDASWRIAIDVRLCVHDLEARLQAIERIPSDGRRRPAQFIPYRFEFANKLSKYDK